MEQTNWYAVYTAFRAEKRVKKRLDDAAIINYLPLRTVERKWGDRVKKVEVPLVCGCIFVRVSENNLSSLLSICGIITLLKKERVPVVILDEQVESLRILNERAENIDIVGNEILSGVMVHVNQGELVGIQGELIDVADKHRIVVRVPYLVDVCTDVQLDKVKKL